MSFIHDCRPYVEMKLFQVHSQRRITVSHVFLFISPLHICYDLSCFFLAGDVGTGFPERGKKFISIYLVVIQAAMAMQI